MKVFFLTGTIIFTVLSLILAFENMGASCNDILFLFFPVASPFFMVLANIFVGFVLGAFFTGFLISVITKKPEDEEAPGGNW